MNIQVEIPEELSPINQQLIAEFAEAMATKLRQAEIKRGAIDWLEWPKEQMIQSLRHHVDKGDMRDVALIAAFIWKVDRLLGVRSPGNSDQVLTITKAIYKVKLKALLKMLLVPTIVAIALIGLAIFEV